METYPKFLSKEPIDSEDYLEGKPLDLEADVILDLIDQGNAKCIGIEGGWGSGKSKLIEILKTKIKEKAEGKNKEGPKGKSHYHLFIFDLWKHQDDSLRKSIIWELKNSIKKDSLLETKKNFDLEEESRLICSSKTVRDAAGIPRASFGAIVMICLLAIMSSGFLGTIDGTGSLKCILARALTIFGAVFAFLLVLYTIYFEFSEFFKNILEKIFHGHFGKGLVESAKKATTYIMSLCVNEYALKSTEYTLEDNPTASDFERYMNKVNELFKDRTLIVVFDNIDRIKGEKIVEFMSFLHTVFMAGEKDRSKNNIALIVTFDRRCIVNAYAGDCKESEPNGSDENLAADYLEKTFIVTFDRRCIVNAYAGDCKESELNGSDENLAADYLEKTFDVIYQMPKPGTLLWKNIFKKEWERAFGNLDQIDEILYIYQLFSDKKGKDVDAYVPRKYISFINEIIACWILLKRIDEKAVLKEYLVSIALYVLNKEKIAVYYEEVQKNPLKSESVAYGSDENTNDRLGTAIFGKNWSILRHFYPDKPTKKEERSNLCALEKVFGRLYHKNSEDYSEDSIRVRECLEWIETGNTAALSKNYDKPDFLKINAGGLFQWAIQDSVEKKDCIVLSKVILCLNELKGEITKSIADALFDFAADVMLNLSDKEVKEKSDIALLKKALEILQANIPDAEAPGHWYGFPIRNIKKDCFNRKATEKFPFLFKNGKPKKT